VTASVLAVITLLAGAVAKYCDEHVCVCLSVCLSPRTSPEPHSRSLYCCVCCLYGRGSVLLRGRCDTLCTSGSVDDIMFSSTMSRIAVLILLRKTDFA